MVWPEVEALLVVPISAHALFSRPLVLGPTSRSIVEVVDRLADPGVICCDGRRTVDLPPGGVEVTRGRTGAAGPAVAPRRSPTGWWPSSACRWKAGAGTAEREARGACR